MNLIDRLIDQTEVSRYQAEGGLGLLLEYAQSRLESPHFAALVEAIPAISDVIGKAPRQVDPRPGPVRAAWHRLFSGWGKLAPLRAASEKLQLDRADLETFIETICSYFEEHGKTEVTAVLRAVWC